MWHVDVGHRHAESGQAGIPAWRATARIVENRRAGTELGITRDGRVERTSMDTRQLDSAALPARPLVDTHLLMGPFVDTHLLSHSWTPIYS